MFIFVYSTDKATVNGNGLDSTGKREKPKIFWHSEAVWILREVVNPNCINSTPNVIPLTYFCGIIRYFHPHVNQKTSLNNS